jgi:hypothetical protein
MRSAARVLLTAGLLTLALPSTVLAQDFAPSEPLARVDDDDWQDPDIDAFYPRRGHFAFKASANGGVRTLFGSLIGLGGIEVAAGADTKAGSFYGAFGGAGGRTEGGLSYGQFTIGPDLEWSVDVLRLGVHPRVGYIAIGRVTEGGPFELFNWGIGGLVGIDLYRNDGITFALGVEPKLEWATTVGLFDDSEDAFLGGASAFLQIRFRAPKKQPKLDGGDY